MAVASNIEPPTDLPTLRKSVGQKRSSLFSSGNADTEETKKYTTEKLQKKSSIADLFEELSSQHKKKVNKNLNLQNQIQKILASRQ